MFDMQKLFNLMRQLEANKQTTAIEVMLSIHLSRSQFLIRYQFAQLQKKNHIVVYLKLTDYPEHDRSVWRSFSLPYLTFLPMYVFSSILIITTVRWYIQSRFAPNWYIISKTTLSRTKNVLSRLKFCIWTRFVLNIITVLKAFFFPKGANKLPLHVRVIILVPSAPFFI